MAEENDSVLHRIPFSGKFSDIANWLNENFHLIELAIKQNTGKSAYEVWRDYTDGQGNQPNIDKTEEEFLASLKESGYKMQAVTVRPSTIATIDAETIYLYPDGTGQFSTAIYTGDLTDTYDSTKWVVLATNPGDLSGAFTDINGLRTDVNNLSTLVGYYVCDTAASTSAKTVQATGYVLTNGGNIRIKMTHANTAAESGVTLQIGSAAAKDLYYNGEPVSPENTWEDNEVVTVYYDGTQYQATNSLGGGGSRGLAARVESIEEQLSNGTTQTIALPRLEIDPGVYVKSGTFMVGSVGDAIGETTSTSSYVAYTKYAKYDVHELIASSITIRSYANSSMGFIVLFTNANGVIIETVRYSTSGNTQDISRCEVTVPQGAYYMYVNYTTNNITLIPGAEVSAQRNVIESIKSKVESIQSQLNDETTGRIEVNLTNGYSIKQADGTITALASYSVTDPIPVQQGTTYYYTGISDQRCVYGYDEDGTALFYLASKLLNDNSATFEHFAFTIPAGVSYIRACGTTASEFYIEGVVSTSKLAAIQSQLTEIMDIIDNLPSGGGNSGGGSSQQKEVFREIPLNLNVGFIQNNTTSILSNQTGFACTDFIEVTPGDKLYVTCKMNNQRGAQGYKIVEDSYVVTESLLAAGDYYKQEVTIGAETTYITINSSTIVTPRLFVKEHVPLDKPTKKYIPKNVRFVGMSIWYHNNFVNALAGRMHGYQDLLHEQFEFDYDSGAINCYSANSLGAIQADRENANGVGASLALKLSNNFDSRWGQLSNAIWTLDTITNDYGRGVALGTTSDYDNNTGADTYYGALRIFADKVAELSGNDAIVIASNSLRRSSMAPINGKTFDDFEQALMYAVSKNGWYFVDQYRLSGITDNTISLTTYDGLHLNNTGYKLAVLPWIAVFDQIYNKLLNKLEV